LSAVTRLFGDASFGFVGKRRRAYLVSGALLLAGLVGVLLNVFSVGDWQRHGVEFTGGALLELVVDPSVTEEGIRGAAGALGPVEVTALGDGQTMLLRAPLARGESVEQLSGRVEQQLAAELGAGVQVLSAEPLGADAGAAALGGTAFALLLVLVLVAAYLAARFGVPAGAAAALAALHDLVILLGLIALLRVVVEPAVIAATLAALTWSLKDKTVVLDRVRDHLSRKGSKKPDRAALIDRALNESLPRSTLTAALTVLFVLALAIVGPAGARGFALVLAVGIPLATYSSLFVLGPLILALGPSEGPDRKKKPRPQTAAV
jgi:preprotein translocase subunit SecF